MTETTGDFGAELDSLCDAVSFGVAPGLDDRHDDAKAIADPTTAKIAWLFGLAFACGAILRLARSTPREHARGRGPHELQGPPLAGGGGRGGLDGALHGVPARSGLHGRVARRRRGAPLRRARGRLPHGVVAPLRAPAQPLPARGSRSARSRRWSFIGLPRLRPRPRGGPLRRVHGLRALGADRGLLALRAGRAAEAAAAQGAPGIPGDGGAGCARDYGGVAGWARDDGGGG